MLSQNYVYCSFRNMSTEIDILRIVHDILRNDLRKILKMTGFKQRFYAVFFYICSMFF